MKLLIISLLLFCPSIYSKEVSESFVIKVYDRYFKVTAPPTFYPKTSLVIENETLIKIYGKIETASGRFLNYITVLPRNFKSLPLAIKASEEIIFTPIAPPAQKIWLTFGKESYEVP